MNQAILFSLLSAPARAGPTTPLVCPFRMQLDDKRCRRYRGPCVLDPQFCCGTFVGYAFEATCERGVGWELTPYDPVPMCGDCSDSTGVAVRPSAAGVPSTSKHDATTENTHEQTTEREEDTGPDWLSTRDRTGDVWVDGATESWLLQGPTWFHTGDKTSTSVRTGDTDSLFNAHLNGESWQDRTMATWDNRNTENNAKTDQWGVDWRNWEQTQKGSKTSEEWGDILLDDDGMSASSGMSNTLKNRETTDDRWGQKDLWGTESEGSRQTENFHDHESRSQVDVDQWGNERSNSHSSTRTGDHEATEESERDRDGNTSTRSSSSTKTTSKTKTSSSSRWSGRSRGRRRVADRLAQAEDSSDVEPSLGDFVNEMLAPSA